MPTTSVRFHLITIVVAVLKRGDECVVQKKNWDDLFAFGKCVVLCYYEGINGACVVVL